MSDVDIEIFSIKDPRPLTAKLEPVCNTDLDDTINVEVEEMDQQNCDTENVYEMNLSRKILTSNSCADVEQSTSSEDKSSGEKRGNISNPRTPYQKRKVRKKDARKRKSFKRVGTNSSTSSINYQAQVKHDDAENKSLSGPTGKGANKSSKEKKAKRKNSQLRAKHQSELKQTHSSEDHTHNKSNQRYNEPTCSSGAQSPTKRLETMARSKESKNSAEKGKPNLEHITKLAETTAGCSNPVHGASWSNPSLSEGADQCEEPMDEASEAMEVCDSQEEALDMHVHSDPLIVDDTDLTHDKNDGCPKNQENIGEILEDCLIERNNTKTDQPDSRPKVRLTNLSLSVPNTREGKRSEDEDSHSTWLLDCRNIWSNNKLKGHYQKIYQTSEFRDRGFQNIRSQVEFSMNNNKPVKASSRFRQGMKSSGTSRGCIMRTVKQGSFVLLGTVKTIKDDRDRLSLNF